MSRDVLVVGARGRIGREVLRALASVDRASLDRALDGVDSAFFVTSASSRASMPARIRSSAPLTGPECAAAWASALARDVAYSGDLRRWPELVGDRMHPRERADFGKTYREGEPRTRTAR